MGVNEKENIGNSKSQSTRNSDWKTLKLKEEVFEGFEEIKRALKAKHGKPVSNSDAMKFLLYLAKVALELDANSKLGGIAEPLVPDKLSRLENYSRSVSDYLGIPIEYIRGGVLWGLLEIASGKLGTSWRESKYYLELAGSWFREYPVYVYETEVSDAIVSIINGIQRVGRNNPHRQEIQKSLFDEVEKLVSLFFSDPNLRILHALVMAEIHTNQWKRALGILERILRYENSQNTNEIREIVSEFLKKAYVAVDVKKFKEFVEGLVNSSSSLSIELFIIETAADFIDVGSFYETILSRSYLLPENRLSVAESMVRTASRGGYEALLSRAIEVAKAELRKLRKIGTPKWETYRYSFALALVESGFGDKISELRFSDEVPTIRYYLLLSLSKLRKDFKSGWEEFRRFLSMAYIVATREDCHFLDSQRIFIPAELSEGFEECIKTYGNKNVNFQRLSVFVFGSCCREIKAGELLIRANNNALFHLRFDKGDSEGVYELPNEVVAPLLKALIESGVSMGDDITKILAAELLRNYDRSLAKALLEEVLSEGIPIYRLGDVGFLKLLNDVGINPVEALQSVLRRTSPEEYEVERLTEDFVKALVFVKPAEEIIGLIKNGSLFEIIGEYLGVDNNKRFFSMDFKGLQERLLDALVEGVAVKHNPLLASGLVLRHDIPTRFLPHLVEGLLHEGDLKRADELASKFGLGWFGRNDLEALLGYRFEKCVSQMRRSQDDRKDGTKDKTDNNDSTDCFKAALLLLKSSKKKLEKSKYERLGGMFIGRLIAWKFG